MLNATKAFIQIDVDAAQIGKNSPVDIGLLGPIDDVVAAMLPHASAKPRAAHPPLAVQQVPSSPRGMLTTPRVVELMNFFVTNTPLAWYADFFARCVEIDRSRTLSTYEAVANVGPALNPYNLYKALDLGLVGAGQDVLLFTDGTVSSAGAPVLRLGDVKLGSFIER
jgi:hypothetical protein